MKRMVADKLKLQELDVENVYISGELQDDEGNDYVKSIYQHNIMIKSTNAQSRVLAIVLSNDNTSFTKNSLFDYIIANNKRVSLNGIYLGKQSIYLAKTTDTNIILVYTDLDEASGISYSSFTKTQFSNAFDSEIEDDVILIN